VAAKRKASAVADAPTFTDYVVRFSHPVAFMRSQVVRVTDESAALDWARHAVADGNWRGWALVDISTVAEAQARLGGARG